VLKLVTAQLPDDNPRFGAVKVGKTRVTLAFREEKLFATLI